jgi:acetylornithine deacetylase
MPDNFLTEQTLVPLLQRLVRHPSEQTDLQEADPKVKAFIADCVAPEIEKLGLGPDLSRCRYDTMGNLILELGPATADRSILFATYAMTHPAARMTDPFSATIIETTSGPAVRGRGVAEQKTAMAAAFAAVAQAAADGLQGRIILTVLSAGETGRHTAIEAMSGTLDTPPDLAIICLGTDSKIGAGNKGRIDIEISVEGRSVHSSTPSAGIDAIDGARHCLNALKTLDLGVPENPVFGAATLTPTAIKSGPNATHTLQDRVDMTFDRRLLPGEDPESAFAGVRDALPTDGPWNIQCRLGPLMYPNEIADDGTLMTLLRGAYADAGLGKAETVTCNFALDAGYFGHRGIEAIMLGPGEIDQFHSEEEHVQISDLLDMAQVYRALIARTFG